MKRIVIVGAGFGGLQAAFGMERCFGGHPGYEVVLVSETNFFLFTPLLPQVASSYINPRHIVQPVRDIRGRRRFRFLRDTVLSVDVVARTLHLVGGLLAYDYLVLATGIEYNYFGHEESQAVVEVADY